MADRHLPVRPHLDQLRRQAKELLRALRAGDPQALEAFRRHHPERGWGHRGRRGGGPGDAERPGPDRTDAPSDLRPADPRPTDARLADARLRDARLADARLRDARLADSRLAEARLADARLADARLADAQLVLARSYGVRSWPRLKQACDLIHAIWRDDVDAVRRLVLRHPHLLHEDARGAKSNWGPPMSYAANLGRDRIVAMLRELGADDLQHAFDRACLQGKLDTARMLWDMGARPAPGAVMGPAETVSGQGMAFLLERGAELADESGDRLAPVALVLETYCRNPRGKHRCLELFAEYGLELPDTPPMALHRGRLDLLEAHVARDPDLLHRTFPHREIWPPELGCHADETLALHGTPLAGGTLLHLCVDYDEVEILRWLLEKGADPDAPAAVDARGFGGHTALFGTVVSQTWRVGLRRDDALARLLLERGADPGRRASLRKRLRFVADETWHEYRDVTPAEWGRRFHDPSWVNTEALRLVAAAAGP